MAQIQKWRGCHVKIETLEKIMGVRLSSLREMYHCDDIEREDICIRLPRDRWGYYGVKEALESIGFENQTVAYINL